MRKAIIGHAEDKFCPVSRLAAYNVMRRILTEGPTILVSGRSPLGGVDVWAEKMAEQLGVRSIIYPPYVHTWGGPGGFRDRNMRIARTADEVHVIVVSLYPEGYDGKVFMTKDRVFGGTVPWCYHCERTDHVKSGACWTALQAVLLGKTAEWHVLSQFDRRAVTTWRLP